MKLLVTALFLSAFASTTHAGGHTYAWEQQLQKHRLDCITGGTDHFIKIISQSMIARANELDGTYSDEIMTRGNHSHGFTHAYVFVKAKPSEVTIGFDNGEPGPRLAFTDYGGDGTIDHQRSAFVDDIPDRQMHIEYCAWGHLFLGRYNP